MRYAISLIEILRTVAEAGEHADEHVEAISQIERALLTCIEFSTEGEEEKRSAINLVAAPDTTLNCAMPSNDTE